MHDKLLKKNLLSLHALIHKKGMISYIFSLVLYQRLYTHLECHTKEDYLLLQKYPPPDKSFFFVKLEEEKQDILHSYEGLLDKLDVDVDKENYEKLMTQVSLAAKRYTEDSFKKMTKVLKLESREKYKLFNQKEEASKKDFNTMGNRKDYIMLFENKFYMTNCI